MCQKDEHGTVAPATSKAIKVELKTLSLSATTIADANIEALVEDSFELDNCINNNQIDEELSKVFSQSNEVGLCICVFQFYTNYLLKDIYFCHFMLLLFIYLLLLFLPWGI